MQQLWFTADTHFDHANILKHTDRYLYFRTVEDMNKAFIASLNFYVQPDDLLVILGDVFWRRAGHFRAKINAKQIWVTQGNHDTNGLRSHVSRMEHILKINDIQACHYPFESWRNKNHGSIHLHGHSHARMHKIMGRLDVGMDSALKILGEYRPFSLEEAYTFAREE